MIAPTDLPCPRCDSPLSPRFGQLHEAVCSSCDGRFIDGDAANELFTTVLGVTPGMLEELAGLFGGAQLRCPGCRGQMRPMQLASVPVDVCLHCGGLWCDHGELTNLTRGRVEEVSAKGEPVPETEAIAAPSGASVLFSDEQSPALAVADDLRSTFGVFCTESPLVADQTVLRAFTDSGVLTALDAGQRRGRIRGILATHLKRSAAHNLAQTFAELGVPCSVVDRARYRPPTPRAIRGLEIVDQALTYLDQYNRRVKLKPEHIAVIGASETTHDETQRSRIVDKAHKYFAGPMTPRSTYSMEFQHADGTRSRTPESTTRTIQTLRVDVMLRHEATRLSAVNEQLFVAGTTRPEDRSADVGRLLQNLVAQNSAIRLSQSAQVGMSRMSFQKERAQVYEEELEWLYWHALRTA